MTAGYILVLVVLVLGGAIAYGGDRLGTKVGKARLSLFKLRPRNTAILLTVLTGSIISASTLGILFAASKPLRTGVFKIDEIQDKLNEVRKELSKAEAQKQRIEAELAKARRQADAEKARVEAELARARAEQAQAQAKLDAINQSLLATQAEQAQTETKLNRTQKRLSEAEAEQATTETNLRRIQRQLSQVQAEKSRTEGLLQGTQRQLKTVSEQKTALRQEIDELQAERQQLIQQREQVKAQIAQRDLEIAQRDQLLAERDELVAQRDREIAQREQAITERDQVIAQREELLSQLGQQQSELEVQRSYLQQQLIVLERDFQAIRAGTVVIRRGQILASGVVRILEPPAARQAVERLLQEANRTTIKLLQPGNTKAGEAVIQITNTEVEQLIEQIKDGKDYVVKILATANYLREEKVIQVFAEAEVNRVVFRTGDVIAGASFNPLMMKEDEVRQQIQQLIDASNFRANYAGIVGGRVQIADDRIETLLRFIERLKKQEKLVDVQAVAADVTYTAGPLRIDLVASEEGAVIFRTGQEEL